MKTYLLDSYNRFKRLSRKLDARTTICNQTWLVFNDLGEREVYKFKENGSLRIVLSGKITEGKWDYDPNDDTISLFADNQAIMVHPGMYENTILALKVDGTDEVAFLIEEGNSENFYPKTLEELKEYFIEKEIFIENERKRKELEEKRKREEEDEKARRAQEELEKKRKEEEDFRRKEAIVNNFIDDLWKKGYKNRAVFNGVFLKIFSVSLWTLIISSLFFIVGLILNNIYPGDKIFPFYLIWLWSLALILISIASLKVILNFETEYTLSDNFESYLSDYKKNIEYQTIFTDKVELAIRKKALSLRNEMNYDDFKDLLLFRYNLVYSKDTSTYVQNIANYSIFVSLIVLLLTFFIRMLTANYGPTLSSYPIELDATDANEKADLSNDNEYKIISKPDWCGVRRGYESIELIADYNYDSKPREGILTIKHNGLFKTFYSSVKVIQKGDTVHFIEWDNPIELHYNDDYYRFKPTADGIIRLTNESQLPNWISVERYKHFVNYYDYHYYSHDKRLNILNDYIFHLKINRTDSTRSAILRFEGGDYSTDIKVIQHSITKEEKERIIAIQKEREAQKERERIYASRKEKESLQKLEEGFDVNSIKVPPVPQCVKVSRKAADMASKRRCLLNPED